MEMVRRLKILNSLGLHARAAAKIVELAERYQSQLFFEKDGRRVDGSNILSILTLACPRDTEVEARIIGEDANELMREIDALFQGKFGENQ